MSTHMRWHAKSIDRNGPTCKICMKICKSRNRKSMTIKIKISRHKNGIDDDVIQKWSKIRTTEEPIL